MYKEASFKRVPIVAHFQALFFIFYVPIVGDLSFCFVVFSLLVADDKIFFILIPGVAQKLQQKKLILSIL